MSLKDLTDRSDHWLHGLAVFDLFLDGLGYDVSFLVRDERGRVFALWVHPVEGEPPTACAQLIDELTHTSCTCSACRSQHPPQLTV